MLPSGNKSKNGLRWHRDSNFVWRTWIVLRVTGLISWYLNNVYNLKMKVQIFLDVGEEITQNVQDLHINYICKSDKLNIAVLSLLLRSSACGSEWGNFWCRSLLQLLWKRVHGGGGRVTDHHTAPVPGSSVFPWQIIPLSGDGGISVCRIIA